MRRMLSLLALSIFVVVSAARAEDNPVASSPIAGTAPATIETPPAAPVPVVQPSPIQPLAADGLVSLDFQDADIHNVLKVLAFKSGVNIVISPEVNGTVTIQLTDVPWQRALEVILSTYGYGYERQGNIITVMSIENLKKRREDKQILLEQEPLSTKTYSLSFAKAADVVDSISKIKSSRGTINFDQRTNTLIVREVQSSLDLMDGVIQTLDSVTPQVLIEAKVVETKLDNADKLGIDWSAQITATGNKRPTALPFKVNDSSSMFPGTFPAADATTFKYGTLDFSAFQAVLQILNTRTDTNILSNPKIVTLDNQPAKIVVGTQYPIPQYTYNTEQAKLQISGWEYKDIGIIFEVTPHVNNAGLVTLDLHPTITGINGSATVENTTLPQLSVEEANTKVMIENGQTLVIAGLIKDQVDVTHKKIPFLGDIPILGMAFKKNENTKTKTELLIFLTPHIITATNPQKSPSSSGK
jgi:type IV pilus assembly protein PilQ